MTSKKTGVFYFALMLLLAAANAVLCALFMFLLTYVANFLYKGLPQALNFPQQFWPLIFCVVGGVIVGFIVKKWGHYPKLLFEVVAEFMSTHRVEYKDQFILKDAGSAFVILLFGAALGPEAVLIGMAGAVGTYTVDRVERNPEMKMLRKNNPLFKRVVFILQWVAGSFVFLFLSDAWNLPSLIYRFTETTFQWSESLWFIPLLALGIVLGLIFVWAEKGFERLFRGIGKHVHVLALITGVVLGVAGVFAPLLLYSGEAQLPMLVQQEGGMDPTTLIVFAVAKLLLAALCLQTGWRGGNIFPLIFASFSLAFGVAALLPLDAAFAVAVIFAALFSFVTKKPILAALFVFLYVPFIFIPFILLAACLASPKESLGTIKGVYRRLRKAPPS